jgi:large subunit ribosomal protein L6
MSRIGKVPVKVDNSVKVELTNNLLKVIGKNGELTKLFPQEIVLSFDDNNIIVIPKDKDDRRSRQLWGLSRTLVFNMIKGVQEGWSEEIKLNGVGYKASVFGEILSLSIGYSHEIFYGIPKGINVKCDKDTITINGSDKQIVGQIAAEICNLRKPDPYKLKGLRRSWQIIRKKENKKK